MSVLARVLVLAFGQLVIVLVEVVNTHQDTQVRFSRRAFGIALRTAFNLPIMEVSEGAGTTITSGSLAAWVRYR